MDVQKTEEDIVKTYAVAPTTETLVDQSAPEDLRRIFLIADSLYKAGNFDIANAHQAVAKILAGQSLGLSEFQSVSAVFLVKGKLALESTAIGALIQQSGRFKYRIFTHDEESCAINFFEKEGGEWENIGQSIFTFNDAKQAGLHKKDVWVKYKRNMLFARALTNGARWFCPAVFGGSVYTPDELEG